MQKDFHYYATYSAAFLAGYTHEESLEICYSAQFVDLCSRILLQKLNAPLSAATTQLQPELMDVKTDVIGLQDITRIWASFHFLPGDLHAEKDKCSKRYLYKYRLICQPNGDLLVDTVNLAKNNSLQAVGLAMHVLADTWAHRNFVGTPSLVMNNTSDYFYEELEDGSSRQVSFSHNPSMVDDIENGNYVASIYQINENSIMNLGHGRVGHLPDYSFMHYRYLPAWAEYEEIVKDNPNDYMFAFSQMVYAMRYLKGLEESFTLNRYAEKIIAPYKDDIHAMLSKRQLDSCADWKAFGEKLSGKEIVDFDIEQYQKEYIQAKSDDKNQTFLGKFFLAALAQKSMVTNRIYHSGNPLAGVSVDYEESGFKGIKDFKHLVNQAMNRNQERDVQ